MKLALQLAYRNLIGSGLKTWLNVGILAFTFLLIIFYNGMMDGWNFQAVKDSISWQYGQGQYFHEDYDPNDPFTIQDGHGVIPKSDHVPILIRQGTIYPNGRLVSAMIKGIPRDQTILDIPTKAFDDSKGIPIVIGKRFAKSNKLSEGDDLLVRWKDKNGTYDAATMNIVRVFDSNVPEVDAGQIWMPLDKLQSLTGLSNQATLLVSNSETNKAITGWSFQSKDALLATLYKILDSKKAGGAIMYILLLSIALLAIFDTQVLSIFRRQKEIGTYVSLGMTRAQVVKLFTVEGTMYSILAVIAAVIVGIPLFSYLKYTGIPIPSVSQAGNISIGEIIYPAYTMSLIVSTILLVVIAATIVSYLPARKISKMDPVNALKGKIQ